VHRELSWARGHGTPGRTTRIDTNGTARVRLKGCCKNCNTVTLHKLNARRIGYRNRQHLELELETNIILSLAMQQREHEAVQTAAQPAAPSPLAAAA
jgi:hypothetical protein